MVQSIPTVKQLSDQIKSYRAKQETIGFVPTMGALHEGHMSLIRKAKAESDRLVVSIFVNPTQFDDPDDYRNYPRTRENDIAYLEQVGCDILFIPDEAEMYPNGPEILDDFKPGYYGSVLEGRFRPGHFQGVATIVKKLLDSVQPDRAYFGQKDYQQLLIIQKLVNDYNLFPKIVPVPTQRETDGLAISSRNILLTEDQRKQAPLIYETLKWAKDRISSGESISKVQTQGFDYLNQQDPMQVEYFEVRDAYYFTPVSVLNDASAMIICTAVKMGKVRLIDNLLFETGT